jgi:hypothetical protein
MRQLVTLSLVLLLLAGCASKQSGGSLTGTITYNGQPVNGALLRFDPTGGTTGNAVDIPVDQEGKFVTTNVPPGDYRIMVTGVSGSEGVPSTKGMDPAKAAEMEAKFEKMRQKPTIPFPQKYANLATSDLTCKITPGKQSLKLELKD